jgi:hypothetical protein
MAIMNDTAPRAPSDKPSRICDPLADTERPVAESAGSAGLAATHLRRTSDSSQESAVRAVRPTRPELCVRAAIDWPHACSDFTGPAPEWRR